MPAHLKSLLTQTHLSLSVKKKINSWKMAGNFSYRAQSGSP